MDSSSRWLDLRDQETLLDKASATPWFNDDCFEGSVARPVVWTPVAESPLQTVPGPTGVNTPQPECASPCWAAHEVAWCQRPEGEIAIHRFKLAAGASARDLLDSLKALVREDMEASRRCDQASNVNGFHGNRDLWLRYEFHQLELPRMIADAISQAAQLESVELDQMLSTSTCDEGWFNVTGPDGWNQQHTHAGSKFACVFFVADGGCCSNSDQLSGRLAFVPNRPERLPDYHLEQVRRPHQRPGKRQKLPTSSPAPQYLLLDPEPGTAVVFPGFLPHFVLPVLDSASSTTENCVSVPLRISCAFNFGERDPVLVHMLVRAARDGESYVKVFLEIDEDVCGV